MYLQLKSSSTSLIVLFLFFFLSIEAQNSYYISMTSGEDTYDGKSEISPWKTTAKFRKELRLGNITSGDTILFKRGDVWENGDYLVLKDGITIKSYGSDTEKPIISNLAILDLSWTIHSENDGITIWKAFTDNTINRLLVNGNEYLTSTLFEDLGINSMGIDSVATPQKWFLNNENILFLVSAMDPNDGEIKSTTKYYTIIGGIGESANNSTIEDIEVRGGYGPAIWINNSDNVRIKNCKIGKYSRSGIKAQGNCYNMIVENNIIDSGWDPLLTYGINSSNEDKESEYRGVGDGILFEGGVSNSTIRNNTIKNWGHTGVNFNGQDFSLEGVNNNHVYSNFISSAAVSYGMAIGINGFLDKCRDNVFSYNRIEDCKTRIQFAGNQNRFHHNIIYKTVNSPVHNDLVGQAIKLTPFGNTYVCQDLSIDNNIIVDSEEEAISISTNKSGSNKISNIYVRNNILIKAGNMATISINSADTTYIGKIKIQNNLIFDSSVNILYREQGLQAIDSMASIISLDVIENNLIETPLFATEYTFPYYTTSANSPCINTGTPVEYSEEIPPITDFDGDTFPVGTPDIGIQEYQITELSKSSQKLNKANSLNKTQLKIDDSELSVYPNPSMATLSIVSKNKINSVKVYNMTGELITLNYIAKDKLNLSSLNKGIYIIKIETSKNTYFKKIIKN